MTSAKNICAHKFAPLPVDNCQFARLCRCGLRQSCSREELQRFLEHCHSIRLDYIRERNCAKSSDSVKAFEKGVELKNQQIKWLRAQIEAGNYS